MLSYILVAIGGALGSTLRFWISGVVDRGGLTEISARKRAELGNTPSWRKDGRAPTSVLTITNDLPDIVDGRSATRHASEKAVSKVDVSGSGAAKEGGASDNRRWGVI